MKLRLSSQLNPEWPPGAWLAHCRRNTPHVEVMHGASVVVTAEWFGEVVWMGPFAEGGFDTTDVVFGSGGRCREDGITFVASASTVDRLQTLERGTDVWVSNSLACLLAGTGSAPDIAYRGYARDFRTIIRGLRRYRRVFRTSREPIQLCYFDNLRWDGARLSRVPKPHPARDLTSFGRYRAFVDDALARIAENMDSAARPFRYRFLGTVSSGYDSPTAATLARNHGLREVITFTEARSGKPDSGAHIAEALALTVRSFPRDAWRIDGATAEAPEIPFLAGDATGQDVFFRAAEPLLRDRVLVTGFHGDKMWDLATRTLTPDIVRGDHSGLSLTEYRLWAGFIHCPVAFLGVRHIRDVHALGRSPEMAAWNIGGTYTRPICRRLVEVAGVPREAFGQQKRAASVHFFYHGGFLTPGSTREFVAWFGDRFGGREPPVLGRRTRSQRAAALVAQLLHRTAARWPGALWRLGTVGRRLTKYADREQLFNCVFPWAMERAIARYARVHAEIDGVRQSCDPQNPSR